MRVPIRFSKPLDQGREYNFRPCYNKSSLWLSSHGLFPEGVVDHLSHKVVYYNNSDVPVRIPATALIGEVQEFDYNERATTADTASAHSFFSLTRVLSAVTQGLAASQFATSPSSSLQDIAVPSQSVVAPSHPIPPAATSTSSLYPSLHSTVPQSSAPPQPTSIRPSLLDSTMHSDTYQKSGFPDSTLSPIFIATSPSGSFAYSLLPPLEPGHSDPKKFGSAAVNINSTDRRTQEEVTQLRLVLQKYEELWEDRVG